MRYLFSLLSGIVACATILTPARAQPGQLFFLDFDTFSHPDPNLNHDYTSGERQQIADEMNDLFSPLGMSVTFDPPGQGVFHSTIGFNAAVAGMSDGVDWRNLKVTDNAHLNAKLLLQSGGLDPASQTSQQIVRASINVGMHEALHLVGARHQDAFTPFGVGIHSAAVSRFDPNYPGPVEPIDFALAGRTFMAQTLALGGISVASLTRDDRFIGLRSAMKIEAPSALPVAELGASVSTDPMFPTLVSMHGFDVPNTLPTGLEIPQDLLSLVQIPAGMEDLDPSELPIRAQAAVAKATIAGNPHYYSFPLIAGQRYTFELMSETLKHRQNFNPFDGTLRVLEFDLDTFSFIPIDYFGVDAENFKGVDAIDPSLVDLLWPTPGGGGLIETSMIVVEVSGGAGDYELLVYRMGVVPEPNTLVLGAAGLALLLQRRRPAAG